MHRPAVEIAVLSADLQELYPVHVNFARRLALIGLEFEQEYDHLVLRLRWKLLAPIGQRLHCFAHVLDAAGVKIDSMDHELLGGSPPVPEWRPGDEASERVLLQLPDASPVERQLRLGVYDAAGNLRWPIWASSLAAADEHTAAGVELGKIPSAVQQYRFPEVPPQSCCVKFEGGVQLSGYSISRRGSSAWLRLFWVFERRPDPYWRFFGHGVTDRSDGSAILASFDQDLAPPWTGSVWEQNIARNLGASQPEPTEIAAGIFHAGNGQRLQLLDSTLPSHPQTRRVFLPLRPGAETNR